MSTVFVFSIMGLLFLALPVIITVVYSHFYSNHANRVLNGETSGKRWMPPFSVFLILFFIEILLFVVFGLMPANSSSGSGSSESYVLNNPGETLDQDEIDATILSCFNGSEVPGYEMEESTEDDFTYQLYRNTEDAMLPAYILRVTYTGQDEVRSWDNELQIDSVGTGTMADFEEGKDCTLYCVVSCSVEDYSDISYTLNLYSQAMDEYDTGDLGTYDMPDPACTFTVTIQ